MLEGDNYFDNLKEGSARQRKVRVRRLGMSEQQQGGWYVWSQVSQEGAEGDEVRGNGDRSRRTL